MELDCGALSDYAAKLLCGQNEFHLLAAFDHVLNLANGTEILSLQDTTIPRTPLSLILSEHDLSHIRETLREEDRFWAEDGALRYGEHTIITQTAERFSCQLTVTKNADESSWYEQLKGIAVLLAKPGSLTFVASPELVTWAGDELTAVQKRAEDYLSQSRPQDLVGLGGGLTPAGDDFLVGVLAALGWSGRTECREKFADLLVPRLGRTPEISRAFLARALAWEFSQPVLDLFRALEKSVDWCKQFPHFVQWDIHLAATCWEAFYGH